MTIVLEHLVTVVSDDRAYGLGSRPVCSCGWCGNWSDDIDAATVAGIAHGDEAAGPASGLDRLCSGLLGVMDDLAEVVSWLAETWPDDLPVPGWISNGADYLDGPAVRVTAYSPDAEVLARAAATLGVAAVDDPAPDSHGNRYRRAVRDFGRVQVEAFGHLDDLAGA